MNQLSPITGFCLVFDPRRSSGCVSKTYIKIIRMKFAQLIFTYSAKISTSLDVEGKKSCSEMVVAKWSEVKVAQSCPTLCDPMNYTVHGISRPEYWSGEPFPFPGNLPNPGIKPRSPAVQEDSLPAEPQIILKPCALRIYCPSIFRASHTEIQQGSAFAVIALLYSSGNW